MIGCIIVAVSCSVPSSENTSPKGSKPENNEQDSVLADLNQKIRADINNPELYYERAMLYAHLHHFSEAIEDMNRALSIDSMRQKYHITKAELLFRQNERNIRQSIEVLQRPLSYLTNSEEVYLKLSEYYLFLRDNRQSIAMANEALKQNNYLDKAYFFKGINFLELKDTAKAISSFQTAVEVNPDNYDAYIHLGILFFRKNPVLAEQYLKNALSLQPENLDVLYDLGLLYQDNGRFNEAMQLYQKLMDKYPAFRESYFNMGYIHLENLKLYREAIKYFSQAITADSMYYAAYYNRGFCYELLGDVMNAERDYRKALAIKPDYDLAANGLSRILEGNKKYR